MPVDCSREAAAISAMISVTRLTEPTISVEGLPRLADQGGAGLDLLDRVLDEALDLLRRGRAALREVAHLGGHDREPAALLAGPRGLDGGVQGEEVGLEGDLVDGREDVGDPLGRRVDVVHGLHRVGDDLAALLGDVPGADGKLVGLAGVVGVLLDRPGDLLQGGRGLLRGRAACACAPEESCTDAADSCCEALAVSAACRTWLVTFVERVHEDG